jgi:DNA polymerase III gamma/tau subunit
MAKRLRIISKREGVDLKALEGGDAIVRTIVSLSNGQMRDAISLLESALFSMKGSKTIDAATVLKNFTTTGEADLEQKAAELLIAILSQDVKTIIRISRQTQGTCRGILSKLRWLIQYSLDNAAGIAKYKPYGAKVFSELLAKNKVKCGLRALIGVQSLLVDVEERFNRMSVDESVVFLSMLSDFSLRLEGK